MFTGTPTLDTDGPIPLARQVQGRRRPPNPKENADVALQDTGRIPSR